MWNYHPASGCKLFKGDVRACLAERLLALPSSGNQEAFHAGPARYPLSAPVDACMDFVADDENLHFREELLVGVRVLTREVIEGAVGLQLNC
jgi:hypothetical protein